MAVTVVSNCGGLERCPWRIHKITRRLESCTALDSASTTGTNRDPWVTQIRQQPVLAGVLPVHMRSMGIMVVRWASEGQPEGLFAGHSFSACTIRRGRPGRRWAKGQDTRVSAQTKQPAAGSRCGRVGPGGNRKGTRFRVVKSPFDQLSRPRTTDSVDPWRQPAECGKAEQRVPSEERRFPSIKRYPWRLAGHSSLGRDQSVTRPPRLQQTSVVCMTLRIYKKDRGDRQKVGQNGCSPDIFSLYVPGRRSDA